MTWPISYRKVPLHLSVPSSFCSSNAQSPGSFYIVSFNAPTWLPTLYFYCYILHCFHQRYNLVVLCHVSSLCPPTFQSRYILHCFFQRSNLVTNTVFLLLHFTLFPSSLQLGCPLSACHHCVHQRSNLVTLLSPTPNLPTLNLPSPTLTVKLRFTLLLF